MSILSGLQDVADNDPDGVAVTFPVQTGLASMSRRELIEGALGLRRELHERGFGRGDCAAIWLPNWPSALIWQLAVGSLGGHVIGINTRYNVHEVTHVLTLARPKVVVIAHDFVGLDLIGRLREAATHASDTERWQPPQVVPASAPGEDPADDVAGYDIGGGSWMSGPASPLGIDELPEPDDELYVAFTTSGSTGLPKLAAHRQVGTLEQLLAAGEVIGAGPSSKLLAALPFSGTFGFVAAFGMLLAGGSIVLQPSFKPQEVLRLISEEGITHLAFGDDMMGQVIELAEAQNSDMTSLQWVGIADFQGGARRLATWLEQNAGAHVTGLYGSSETFALLTTSGTEVPAPDRWLPGGTLTPSGLEYRIADGEQVVTDGSEGEIQFRGPQAVDAYLGQPEKMAENHTSDGWFRSGDLGRALDARSFRYVCRASEALRLKGFLVEPDEIANHIATHPAVEIAKVVGVRRDAGDEAVGFVTLRNGQQVDGDELVSYCANALAKYKVPTAVYVVDEMPVTVGTNGVKIRASVLQEWAAERLG